MVNASPSDGSLLNDDFISDDILKSFNTAIQMMFGNINIPTTTIGKLWKTCVLAGSQRGWGCKQTGKSKVATGRRSDGRRQMHMEERHQQGVLQIPLSPGVRH